MSNPCPFMTISQNAWILLYVSLKRVQWLLRKLLLFLKYLQGTRASSWVIPNRAAKMLWQYSCCLQCNHLLLNCSPQLPHSVSGEEGKTSKAPLWHDSPNLFYSLNIWHAPKEKKNPFTCNQNFSRCSEWRFSFTVDPLAGVWPPSLWPHQVAEGSNCLHLRSLVQLNNPSSQTPMSGGLQLPLRSPTGTTCISPEQGEKLRHR